MRSGLAGLGGEIPAAKYGLTFQEKALKVWGIGGNNSAVECNLAKVEVAGSNPVSRSRIQKKAIDWKRLHKATAS